MSFVQQLLANVPTIVIGMIMISMAIALSLIGLLVIRTCVPTHKIKIHNDVAGFIFATLGVIYAVMLAFMVVVVWQNFDEAHINTAREANYLADLYRDAQAFPPSFKTTLVSKLDLVVNAVIKDEWPLLAKGKRSQIVDQLGNELWQKYASYKPQNETEKIFLHESVSKLNEAGELRRQRLLSAQTGIHPILWFVLVAGGIITISFTLFFGTENYGAQMGMTSLLASLIALILFTIMALDYPFSGDVRITPKNFSLILQNLATIK